MMPAPIKFRECATWNWCAIKPPDEIPDTEISLGSRLSASFWRTALSVSSACCSGIACADVAHATVAMQRMMQVFHRLTFLPPCFLCTLKLTSRYLIISHNNAVFGGLIGSIPTNSAHLRQIHPTFPPVFRSIFVDLTIPVEQVGMRQITAPRPEKSAAQGAPKHRRTGLVDADRRGGDHNATPAFSNSA